ncbi:hypothetical protein AYO44_01325 [Planctomycetaceae bacterium SCGC AG-212-F19]|nr:hypothetical protein AYO44_01325 [Planctomycetaceae bacterium SCGC AG-212-F19]
MPYQHSLFVVGLASLSVFFISAPKRQPALNTAPPPVYPLRPAPAASAILDRAATEFDPSRLEWLQMTFTHRVNAEPLSFESAGTYQAGPNQRLHVEWEVRSGAARRRLQTISDGQTIWEIEEAGSDRQRVLQRPKTPDQSAAATKSKSAKLPGIIGPAGTIAALRREVTFTHQEKVRWGNRDVLVLTGASSKSVAGECPPFQPRQCRLVLDAVTYWPHRVEWWGPAPGVTGDVRLVQIEMHQPVLHEPLPESLFTFKAPSGTTDENSDRGARRRRSSSGWSVIGWPVD